VPAQEFGFKVLLLRLSYLTAAVLMMTWSGSDPLPFEASSVDLIEVRDASAFVGTLKAQLR
jgi:hypothetical protein